MHQVERFVLDTEPPAGTILPCAMVDPNKTNTTEDHILKPSTEGPTTGGALTDRMTAETIRVRADIACVTYTYGSGIDSFKIHQTSKLCS